jgi:plastocyanin
MRRTSTCIVGAAALITILAGCGSSDDDGPAAAGCDTSSSSITVEAQDKLQFDADSYEAKAGCIDVTYRNGGSVAHTLLVKDHKGFKLSIGDTDTGTITLDPGTYTLYCDVAGHEAAGMEATLTVS